MTARFRFLPAAVCGVLLAVQCVPYLHGLSRADNRLAFRGTLIFPEDFDTYAGFVRQAAGGRWLFDNNQQPFDREGRYFNLLWLAAGRVAGATGAAMPAVWFWLRLAAAGFFLWAWLRLCRRLGFGTAGTTFAVTAAGLAGGLGWLGVAFPQLMILPPDLYTELYPAVQLLATPHVSVSLGCCLAGLAELAPGRTPRPWRAAAWLAAAGLVRPYDLLSTLAFLGLWTLALPELRREWPRLLPPGLTAGVPLAYHAWLTSAGGSFAAWGAHNHYAPPAFGVMLVAALPWTAVWLAAGVAGRRESTLRWLLLWGGTVWLLLWLSPLFPFSWRFSSALMAPPLLAAAWAVDRLAGSGRRTVAAGVALALLLPSLPDIGLLVRQRWREIDAGSRLWYTERTFLEGCGWLAQNAPPGSVVLADGHYSLQLPGCAPVSLVLGHKDLIDDFERKSDDYRRLFHGPPAGYAEAADLLALLRLWRVDFVMATPRDRNRSAARLGSLPFLKREFDNDGVTVYRVGR